MGRGTIEQMLAEWGLPAIAAGSFLEGDAVAFMGGVLAHRGYFSYEAAALAATLGAVAVDQALFHAGRHLARFPRARRILDRPNSRRLADWARDHPDRLCLSFRFLYGLKSVGALALGAAAIPPRRFLVLDIAGCLAWAHVVTALGFGVGQAIERIFGRLETIHHLGVAVATVILSIAAWAVWGSLRRRAKVARTDKSR